jgi:hypothetical protein
MFMITPAEMMAIRCGTVFAEYDRGLRAMSSLESWLGSRSSCPSIFT